MNKILVLTTGYPRDRLDNSNIFIKHLYRQLSLNGQFDFLILAADSDGKIQEETRPNIKIKRYKYWFKNNQRLVYGDSILSNLKKSPWLIFQAIALIIVQIIKLPMEILKYKPALIHAHWAVPCGIAAVIWGKLLGLPVLVTSHGSDVYGLNRGWKKLLLKLVYYFADSLNAVSQAMANDIQNMFGGHFQAKLWVQSMGVDQNKFKYFAGAKEKLDMAEDEKIILFVGRLSLGKGLQYLIAAWPAVKALFSSAKLLFIGSGNEEPCLKQQVLDLGLKNSVIFKGAIPNDQLPVYYSAADVFVLPSILTQQGQEGMPVVIIEALLSGCWVIASKIGGVADLSGMAAVKTVVPENTKELSEKITQCLRQGRPAFDQRINNFTLSAAALAYAQKYQELIN